MKKILFIVMSALFLVAGCSGDVTSESIGGNGNGGNTGGQTGLSINVNTLTVTLDLETNTSFKLDAFTADSNGSNISGVTYTSDNSQVASVTSDGTITAVAKGYTFIKIASTVDANVTLMVEVIVNETEQTTSSYKINITPSTITLEKDKQVALNSVANVTTTPPMNDSQFLHAKSNNTDMLKVLSRTDTIQLTALQTGNTSIDVSIKDFNGTYATITVPVYIKEAGIPDPVIYPDSNYATNAEQNKDKMYLKIKFDAYSDTGDLYKDGSYVRNITFSNYNEKCDGAAPCNAHLFEGNDKGFIWNIGYCEKYGCIQGNSTTDNAKIAKYKMGTTHYESNNNAFITISGKSGNVLQNIYVIFYKSDNQLYQRQGVDFTFNLNNYNPQIHKNIAKYTLTITNGVMSATFDGFELK